MTKEEFDELQGKANKAALIDDAINTIERALSGGIILDIFHASLSAFRSNTYITDETVKIDDKVFTLVKKEYEILLEELKARFSEM